MKHFIIVFIFNVLLSLASTSAQNINGLRNKILSQGNLKRNRRFYNYPFTRVCTLLADYQLEQ